MTVYRTFVITNAFNMITTTPSLANDNLKRSSDVSMRTKFGRNMYQLSHGAECNMRNIFRVLFVSVIFHEPKASEIQETKRTRKIFPYCTKQRAILIYHQVAIHKFVALDVLSFFDLLINFFINNNKPVHFKICL